MLVCPVGHEALEVADRHRIAAKHLMTSAQLLPVVRSEAKTIEELVAQGLMSAGSAHLIGEEVLALLNGRRALSVRGGKVDIVEAARS